MTARILSTSLAAGERLFASSLKIEERESFLCRSKATEERREATELRRRSKSVIKGSCSVLRSCVGRLMVIWGVSMGEESAEALEVREL